MHHLLSALTIQGGVCCYAVYTHRYVCIYLRVHIRMCMYGRVFMCTCFPALSAQRAKEQTPQEQGAHLEPRSQSLEGTRPPERWPTSQLVWGCEMTLEHVVMLQRGSELKKPEGTRHRAQSGQTGLPPANLGQCMRAEVTKDGHTSQTGKRPPASVPVTGA